ncbi:MULTISPECIES: hypothetical protein [unclassified Rhodococcus (in: high G+C Gram-positive bacteria)]|uniref:hypothetical protein n=1 Tax=unclassified Rhodococcus (in: high G+C Gram-positive bacteria) TaxID=192944 RepID=UPI000BE41499|nr:MULTISPECIES: hypothetical protein [unclassified Rhodococcus (in: high G+C Gram-positive bacteria)]MBP1161351.1 hypothetical protein [Rhodococcus sp. PvR099]
MLAAFAVVAGGLTTGVGTAAAVGSADLGGTPTGLGSVGLPLCGPGFAGVAEKQVGDVTVRQGVDTPGEPGSGYLTSSFFRVASDETRYIQRYTDYPPSAAYKLRSIRIEYRDGGTGELVTENHPPTSVDAQTGAVTVTGNWTVRGGGYTPNNTYFYFEYDVPWTVEAGSIQEGGVGFTASGLPPQDWPVMDGLGFKAKELCYRPPYTGNM